MITFMWQDDIVGSPLFIDACLGRVYISWPSYGDTRHLISPMLAVKCSDSFFPSLGPTLSPLHFALFALLSLIARPWRCRLPMNLLTAALAKWLPAHYSGPGRQSWSGLGISKDALVDLLPQPAWTAHLLLTTPVFQAGVSMQV